MAFKLIPLALDYGPADALDRIVFISLCERADGHTGTCWPSRADLLERTRLSDASISRRLRRLEKAGWIARQRRFNQSSLFRVNIARLRKIEAERLEVSRTATPEGFTPFAEEIEENEKAAETAPQATEKQGSIHTEQTYALTDRSICSDGAPNLSKNLSINLKALSNLEIGLIQRGSSFFHKPAQRVIAGAELETLSKKLKRAGML